MDFAVRQVVQERKTAAAAAHRCPQCRETALVLHKRHVSPPRLGAALVTEYYVDIIVGPSFEGPPVDAPLEERIAALREL